MRASTALLALVLAAALIGCNAGPGVVDRQALETVGMDSYWDLSLELPPGTVLTQLWLLDENLYALTNRNFVYAIHAADGRLLWGADLGSPYQTVFPPAHVDAAAVTAEMPTLAEITGHAPLRAIEPVPAVAFTNLNTAFLFHRQTGRLYRRLPLEFTASSGPGVDSGYLYAGSTDGRVHAVRLMTGARTWTAPTGGDVVTASPQATMDQVYAGGRDGMLYSFRRGRREQPVWRQVLVGPVIGEFHAGQRGVFVATGANHVYGFHPMTGERLWEPVVVQRPVSDPLQMGDHSLFVHAANEGLYAIAVASGDVRWRRPQGRMVLSQHRGMVYVLDEGRMLSLVDEVTGDVVESLPLSGLEIFARNAHAPAIFAANRRGDIYCISVRDQARLQAEDFLTGPMR